MLPLPNPQEIYLLERYISPAYFAQLLTTWREMIAHLERCLSDYRSTAGSNRSHPLPEQADIVWGQRVIPNFKATLEGLERGFERLSKGDVKGLASAWGPNSDFKGQMDYWSGWMPRHDENIYGELLNKSVQLASNICTTEGAYWEPHDLANYNTYWGPLDPPLHWPLYCIRQEIVAISGQPLQRSGIYLPDLQNSCAQFLSTAYDVVPNAKVLIGTRDLLHPTTGEKYDEERVFEERSCTWYLVERSSSDVLPLPTQAQRVVAGAPCPQTGFYFTPALHDSRRLFKKGEIMPAFDNDYGNTIWQWDSEQA